MQRTIIFILVTLTLMYGAASYAQTPVQNPPCGPQLEPDGSYSYKLCVPLTPGETTVKDPSQYVNSLYLYSISIGGILALVLLIYSGVQYLLAAGNASEQGEARARIWRTVLGLIVLMSAVLILDLIDPRLKKLQFLRAPQVVGLQDRKTQLRDTIKELRKATVDEYSRKMSAGFAAAGTDGKKLGDAWRTVRKQSFTAVTELGKTSEDKNLDIAFEQLRSLNPRKQYDGLKVLVPKLFGGGTDEFDAAMEDQRQVLRRSFTTLSNEQMNALLVGLHQYKESPDAIQENITPYFVADNYFAGRRLSTGQVGLLSDQDIKVVRILINDDPRLKDFAARNDLLLKFGDDIEQRKQAEELIENPSPVNENIFDRIFNEPR